MEFDDDRYHNLFIFPNRTDTDKPDFSSSKVKYYAAGEHEVGSITLQEGEILYIDEGATVYSSVSIEGSNTKTVSYTHLPEMANAYNYGNALNEALCNDGMAPRYTQYDLRNMLNGVNSYLYPNIDWKKMCIRDRQSTVWRTFPSLL